MKISPHTFSIVLLALMLNACQTKRADPHSAYAVRNAGNQLVQLPPPYQTKPTNTYCKVIGWPKGKTPVAPAGFKVNLYAEGLNNPRNIYVAPNGDVFVSQANTELGTIKRLGADLIGIGQSQHFGKSANNILLFRDTNGDGLPDLKTIFLAGLNQPYGMLIVDNRFYVANTDGIMQYPYTQGQTRITAPGKIILKLPAGGYNNHWTRNLRANSQGTKIYVSVGSGSNEGEHGMENEQRRADVLEINPDGSGELVYASGLRNPAGIDFLPGSNTLYASVNERDDLGDNLVPDYFTSLKRGGFYGWPYAYFGPHEDPNHKGERADLVKNTIIPDVSLGSHTASLGLAFYTGKVFPAPYQSGAYIGQHGSWNSSILVGYKVLFIPFNGKQPGKPVDFLTGFIADRVKQEVYGRPVGIAVAHDGSLLAADDTGDKIWRVSVR